MSRPSRRTRVAEQYAAGPDFGRFSGPDEAEALASRWLRGAMMRDPGPFSFGADFFFQKGGTNNA